MRWLLIFACACSHATPVAPPQASAASQPASVPVIAPPPLDSFLPLTVGEQARAALIEHEAKAFSEIFKASIVALYDMCGALRGAEADYGSDHVLLVDTGRAANALCVFGNEKTLDAKPIESATAPQGAGYSRPGHTFAWRGRYYLRVTGASNSFGGGKSTLVLTNAILNALPNPSTPDPDVEGLKALPMIGRIPGSDRYWPQAVFGFESLRRGFSADFGCGEAGLSIAHIALPQGSSATATVGKLRADAAAQGYQALQEDLGDESFSFRKEGKPLLQIVRVGSALGAIEADGPLAACAHIPRELVRVLQP